MGVEWYYTKDGERHGPVTAAELKRLAADGGLSPDDTVWKDGMAKPAPAKMLKGLFPTTKIEPPTPDRKITKPPALVEPLPLPDEKGNESDGTPALPRKSAAAARMSEGRRERIGGSETARTVWDKVGMAGWVGIVSSLCLIGVVVVVLLVTLTRRGERSPAEVAGGPDPTTPPGTGPAAPSTPDGVTRPGATAVSRVSVNGRVWEKQFELTDDALGRGYGINGVVISPGGDRLGVYGSTVKMYDLGSGKPIAEYGAERFISINSLGIAPNNKGTVWARAGIDGNLVVSDAEGKGQTLVEGHRTNATNPNTGKPVYCYAEVAISPDGRRFASAPRLDGEGPRPLLTAVNVYDLQSREFLRWVGGSAPAAFAPDGNTIAVKGDTPNQVLIYPVGPGGPIRTLSLPSKTKSDHVWQIAFSPDGATLATVSPVGLIFWDVATGEVREHFVKAEADLHPRRMCFSADGKRVAVGYTLEAGRRTTSGFTERVTRGLVKVFDRTSGAVVTLEGPSFIYAVALSPDGTVVATAGPGEGAKVRVWRERPGREGEGVYQTPDRDREDDAVRVAKAKADTTASTATSTAVPAGNKLTYRNYDRILIGMSRAEVEQILGPGTVNYTTGSPPDTTTSVTWEEESPKKTMRYIVSIHFRNGKVHNKDRSGFLAN